MRCSSYSRLDANHRPYPEGPRVRIPFPPPFLRTKSITRYPTVCPVPTRATVADADRAAYYEYVAAKEAARLGG